MVVDGDGQVENRDVIVVTNRSIELRWYPARFLMETRFVKNGVVCTGEDAVWLIEHTRPWFESSARFGSLIDCEQLAKTDARWRATLAEYTKTFKFRQCLAWYNASLLIRVTVQMFWMATPSVEGMAFAQEADARAWLRERGIG